MIGVNKRIIAVDNDGAYLVMLNPVIVRSSPSSYEAEEGCLSLERHAEDEALPLHQGAVAERECCRRGIKTFTGWTAEIIQHEIDHCEGDPDMIFWFSGTGNSKYAAQRMAEALNEPHAQHERPHQGPRHRPPWRPASAL